MNNYAFGREYAQNTSFRRDLLANSCNMRVEYSQVTALAGFGIFPAGVNPVAPVFQFTDHVWVVPVCLAFGTVLVQCSYLSRVGMTS